MATRRQPLIPGWLIPGVSATTLVVAVALAAFLALWWNAPQDDWVAVWQDSYLWHVVRFSFWQAFLSALLSVIPAIFLARALYRRRFPGRLALLRLCAMTLILPVLVAVFAPQAWQKLAKKTVTVTKGWSEAYGLFLKGESDLVLSYTTSPAYHILEEKKDNYAAANFSEGHYLQVEVAARTAASKQPELAQKFLQFMVSPAFQNAIPTGNWMYPVANVTLPAGFEKLTKPATTLEFTPAEVAAQRQAWISEWQRAVSR